VALALKEQVLGGGEVPMGENDWRVDMIITMDGIIDLSEDFLVPLHCFIDFLRLVPSFASS